MMRTIYYATLSIQRGNLPAILDDVEFADVPSLDAFLAAVHEADSPNYLLATSGEREVPFHHKMKGDTLATEFAAHANLRAMDRSVKRASDAAGDIVSGLREMRVKRTGVDESANAYFARIIAIREEDERKRKRDRRFVSTMLLIGFACAAWAMWKVWLA